MRMPLLLRLACLLAITSCHQTSAIRPASGQEVFFDRISELCGKTFAGKLVSFDDSDLASFGGPMLMHVEGCRATEIRIPFHVGENRSRTWLIRKTRTGLSLKHAHRHENGSEDALSQYGGDTLADGSALRQEFPADAFSKALFSRNAMPASIKNTWAIEIGPGTIFAYELRRSNRHFRVEFDLDKPVANPPPAWGAENTDRH